jgi:hypothetical protein
MMAVMEYLAAEILELAGNAARDNKKSRHLNQAFSIVDITSHMEMVVKEKPHTNLTKSYQFD